MTAQSQKRLTDAYRSLFTGQGKRDDADLVLGDLAALTGYHRRPSYGEWMAKTKSPQGFELHSALCNARAEVVQHIMGFLTLTDDDLVMLEKAARLERR
jgi:hypothetical protein